MNFTENHDTSNDDYVESVSADKTRILLSNGAEIVGTSFRLAPWGFAFLEDVTK